MSGSFDLPSSAAAVIIQLYKGVIYQDRHPELWRDLLGLQAVVRDYVAVLGLRLYIDEAEGYAFLRQAEQDEEDTETALPRLIQRRQLSYPVSLLLVLLRKRLVEQDAGGGETRVILSRNQIVDLLRVYLPESGSEAKAVEQIDRHINRVVEYGFLRRLKGDEERYELRRIIKALVDARWLGDLDERLKAYEAYGSQK